MKQIGGGVGVKKNALNNHLVNKIFVKQNHKQWKIHLKEKRFAMGYILLT